MTMRKAAAGMGFRGLFGRGVRGQGREADWDRGENDQPCEPFGTGANPPVSDGAEETSEDHTSQSRQKNISNAMAVATCNPTMKAR